MVVERWDCSTDGSISSSISSISSISLDFADFDCAACPAAVAITLCSRPGGGFLPMDLAILAAVADLRSQLAAAQEIVHRFRNVVVHGHALPVLDLYEHVEGWRRLALEHGLLRAAASGFLVAERHAIDAAHQVAERGVKQEIFKRDAVGRADQLHPALGDRACCRGLKLAADLVDDDDLWHVVFHGLDHHFVLLSRLGHLHAPCAANGRMRDIAVAADLVGRVHDDRALGGAQHTGRFRVARWSCQHPAGPGAGCSGRTRSCPTRYRSRRRPLVRRARSGRRCGLADCEYTKSGAMCARCQPGCRW